MLYWRTWFSGEQLSEDPRRTADYRERVVKGLGFDPESKDSKPWLNQEEFAACAEVLKRKAAAFWVPGTPRTTIRHVQHDTIPTGPPVKTPPHRLSPEAAEWIDQKIEEEVARGQLTRGNSPPFPTREAAAHQRARKRRIVVDYRRVNARVLRNSYYSRKASEVIAEAAGSAYLTLLDAVTGFNQVENTDRAKRVLALVSRSGQFLPICLTFGPQNGPEDFAYVVDRIYAPGRHRKLRLMKQWLPYVDDLTIRTGRVLDGVVYRDEEMTARVRAAVELSNVQEQQIGEALEACGFATKGLSTETGWSQAVGSPAPAPATNRPKKGVTQRGSPGKIGGATQGVEGVAGVEAEEEFVERSIGEPAVVGGVVLACWGVQGFGNSLAAVFRSPLSARALAVSSGFPGRSHGSSSEGETGEEPGSGRMPSRRAEATSDPAGLGKRLTVLLRHGRGVLDEELKKYVSVGGCRVQIEKVKEWLDLEPTGGELLRMLEAACVHPDSKGRIEMGEVPSDPEKRYIRARHSWSIPWITEGLDEADVRKEPAELFHGTRRTNWEGIKRYGLMSERALLGRKGRLHLHFCRAREHVKQGSEVVIKVLYRRAAEENEKVYGNEKAIYVLFSIPVDCLAEVTDLWTGEDLLKGQKIVSSRPAASSIATSSQPAASGAAASSQPAALGAASPSQPAATSAAFKAQLAAEEAALPEESRPRPKAKAGPVAEAATGVKDSAATSLVQPTPEQNLKDREAHTAEGAKEVKSEVKEGQTVMRSEEQESKKDRVGKLEPKKKRAKVKAEVSAEEALGEKEAKWAKAREVPGTDDESGSYSYEEDEGECSVDWGGDDADRRSRTPEGRRPGVILKSKGYLELEARMADPAGEGSAADTQPGTAGASGTTDTQDAQVPAGASGTADSQANPASSAGRLDTASRRKAIEEDIKEHGAVVCPRCDARNATWRLKCYRCGLERPNPKDIVREHGDRRSTRGKKRGGKKNRGAGQGGSQAESETWTQTQNWWQSQDWSESHGSRSSDWQGSSWSSRSNWTWGKYDPKGSDQNHPFAHPEVMVMRAAAATIALAGLRGVLRLTEQAVESVLALIQVIEVNTAEVVEQAQMTLTDLVQRSVVIGFILLWGWIGFRWWMWKQSKDRRILDDLEFKTPHTSPEKGDVSSKASREHRSPLKRPSTAILRAKALGSVANQGGQRAIMPLPGKGPGTRVRTSRSPQVEKVQKGKASNKVPRKAAKSPTPFLNGGVKSLEMFATAREYQEAAILALRSCSETRPVAIDLIAYAIDRADLLGALLAVAEVHQVPVKVIADQAQTNRMAEQKRVLEQAAEGGLDVQLRTGNELRSHYLEAGRQGNGFRGIQHAKVLAIEWQDSWEIFAGSSNWTTASRGNHELGWRVELHKAGGLSNQLRNWLDSVCEGSVPMTQVRAEKNQKAGGKSTDQTARLSRSETQS